MNLYFVAAVLKPTRKEEEDGQGWTILVEPKAIFAKDRNHATMKLAKELDAKYLDNDRLEIKVLEFGSGGVKPDWKALTR